MNSNYLFLNNLLELNNQTILSNKLPQRVLGKTNVKVSILGLGGSGFLTDMKTDNSIENLLYDCYHLGINFYDTARSYGKGKSEENLSLLVGNKNIRKNIFVATKTRCRKYSHIMREIEESLKALKTDYIDLMQIHFVNSSDDLKDFEKKDGILSTFEKLKKEKIVKFIGMTGHPNITNVVEALKMYDFDTLMCFANPLKNKNTSNQIKLAIKKNMGIIGMKVFGGSTPAKILKDKKIKINSDFLIRYALTLPITLTIPAVSNKSQLLENIKSVQNFKQLSLKEMLNIEQIVNQKN